MSAKNKLDQYFTNPVVAKHYSDIIKDKYGEDVQYIEPSAGEGSFSKQFSNIISYDLDPKFDGCIEANFLLQSEITCTNAEKVFVGNPPFGKNSSIALKFMDKCFTLGATAVCFILPMTFKKRFFQEKINLDYGVVYEEDVPRNSFLLDGVEYDVPCVFQIWERKDSPREILQIENIWFKEVPKDQADFCVRRVGGRAGKVLDGFEYSESSTYFLKELLPGTKEKIKAVEKLLQEESKNTAGVRSVSKKEICYFLSKL